MIIKTKKVIMVMLIEKNMKQEYKLQLHMKAKINFKIKKIILTCQIWKWIL